MPVEEAEAAHDLLYSGKSAGKAILKVRADRRSIVSLAFDFSGGIRTDRLSSVLQRFKSRETLKFDFRK